MPPDDSPYLADWIRIAEKDLGRVQMLLREGDAEAAGFYLQQAVEKFLKAFLLARGWKLKRIHDLAALLDDAVEYDPGLERFRDACDRVTSYYVIDRYPGSSASKLTEQDVRDSLVSVDELINTLRQAASS